MSETLIKGIAFVSVYVDDFETSYKFYNEVLRLEKEYDMGKLACFFKLGADSGLYLQGGNKKNTIDDKTMRTAFTLNVTSANAMFEKLKEAGVKFVQNAPMDMGQENFWFQFYDPSGNILEILGGK